MTRVLVAEDEHRIREVLMDNLSDLGYEVIGAENGSTALEQVRREHPDVILLDVMMPVMDGFEALSRLKEDPATEDIPVILLTAMDAAQGERTAMELGVEHYMSKPVELDLLKATMNLVLRGSETIETPIKVGNFVLDEKLGGGIPVGSLTLIEGSSSAGKSVLCQHFMSGALTDGHHVSCFSSENNTSSLLSQMQSIGMDVSRYLRTEHLRVFPLDEPGLDDAAGALLAALSSKMASIPKQHKVIVVDSITNLASVAEDHAVVAFFSTCKRLCHSGKTVILVVHSFAFDEKMLIRLRSLCDAHFTLSVETVGAKQVRVMEVSKVHNAATSTGNVVSFEVEPGMGMKIIPVSRAKA